MVYDQKAPVIAGLTVGIALVLVFATLTPSLSILYSDEPLTITGQIACLPHSKIMGLFGSFETSECAIGFRAQDGKHYGFERVRFEQKHDWLLGTHGSIELFNVTGVVRTTGYDFKQYEVAAVIDILSVASADGTISIYEVYALHYHELSEIAEEISERTGGGYSIGVDTGCDDLEQASEGEEYCILVALDNDLPELSSKIPRSLEGYKVAVIIFENS